MSNQESGSLIYVCLLVRQINGLTAVVYQTTDLRLLTQMSFCPMQWNAVSVWVEPVGWWEISENAISYLEFMLDFKVVIHHYKCLLRYKIIRAYLSRLSVSHTCIEHDNIFFIVLHEAAIQVIFCNVFIASVVALIVSPCTLFLYASFNDHSDMHTKPLTHLIMHQPLCLTSWLHHYYHCLFAYVHFRSAERWNCASVLISTVWPANFRLVSKKIQTYLYSLCNSMLLMSVAVALFALGWSLRDALRALL